MTATIAAYKNISSMYSSENNSITDTNKANTNKVNTNKINTNKSLLNKKTRYIQRSKHRISTFKR